MFLISRPLYLAALLFYFTSTGTLLYQSLQRVLKIRRSLFLKSVLLLASGVAACTVIFISDWANLLPAFAAFLAAVFWCCEGSSLKRLTLGILFGSTVFAFNALIDNYALGLWELNGQPKIAAFVLRIIFCFVLFLVTKRFSPKNDFELSPTLWRLFLLLTLTPAGIVLCCVLLVPYSMVRPTFPFLTLFLVALFSFVSLLWTVIVLAGHQKLEQEAAAAEFNRKYYELLEQQHFQIRRLRHDMVNHLQTLASLEDRQKDDYIQSLLHTPQLSRTLKYCQDDTVNAVLSVKADAMEKERISFEVKADIRSPLAMEKPDICAIFGNALDNAIEAVRELPEDDRVIRLEARLAKGMLVVRIENPCLTADDRPLSHQPAPPFSLPPTTKSDPSSHGIGLRSVQEAVRKYDGHMEISARNEAFLLFIYCTLPFDPHL